MGKYSNFEKIPRDFYPTPFEAVVPLIPHLKGLKYFCEPCAGDGRLSDYLETLGMHCVLKSDIEPQRNDVSAANALNLYYPAPVITNPPWTRKILHPMINHFSQQVPTWLLFQANWMHTLQAEKYMPFCKKIVSVGRVKWFPDSKSSGKEDCCWYLFDKELCKTNFHTRNGFYET